MHLLLDDVCYWVTRICIIYTHIYVRNRRRDIMKIFYGKEMEMKINIKIIFNIIKYMNNFCFFSFFFCSKFIALTL